MVRITHREISTEENNVSKCRATIQSLKKTEVCLIQQHEQNCQISGCDISVEYFRKGKELQRAVVEAQKHPEVFICFVGDDSKIWQIDIDHLQGILIGTYLFLQTSRHLKDSHCCSTKQTTWKPFTHLKYLLKIFYILGNSECFTHENKSLKLAGERTLYRWRTWGWRRWVHVSNHHRKNTRHSQGLKSPQTWKRFLTVHKRESESCLWDYTWPSRASSSACQAGPEKAGERILQA